MNTALTGATMYVSPNEKPIRDGVVVIEGSRIREVGDRTSVRVPEDATTIDCSGMTIVAGFWNSHVHFFERKWTNAGTIPADELGRQLHDMFGRFGFTNVFDLSSPWENTRQIRDRINAGEVSGPRIRSTGLAILPPNALLPPDSLLDFMGVMKIPLTIVADAEETAAVARARLDDGVDGIKLFMSTPSKSMMPLNAIEAAASEAHRAGKPLFAHPNTGADVLCALQGGVDVIAHTTPHSGTWDEAILREIQRRRVAITPTLAIWKYFARHDRISGQDKIVGTETGQLRAWIDAGGTVLYGSDIGALEYDPADEYALMSAAGMTFPQILASLTTTPAEHFGETQRLGRVAPGFEADLVVLKEDPAEDVGALTGVEYTFQAGKIVHPVR
jgi:imidazolonepropionase-like amidohydrolase